MLIMRCVRKQHAVASQDRIFIIKDNSAKEFILMAMNGMMWWSTERSTWIP